MAQCSFWRNGLCQVKFFELAPWSNYNVISFDPNDYSIVYSCSQIIGGLITIEYMWILARKPYNIGSIESDAFKSKVFAEITKL